jgi:hypothetical protein
VYLGEPPTFDELPLKKVKLYTDLGEGAVYNKEYLKEKTRRKKRERCLHDEVTSDAYIKALIASKTTHRLFEEYMAQLEEVGVNECVRYRATTGDRKDWCCVRVM